MRSSLVVLSGLLLFGGCASLPEGSKWSLPNPLSSEPKEEKPYPTPVKIASTWAPDVLSAPGKTSTRGFGGRLFFYDQKSRAIPVKGELTIIGYVDRGIPGAPPITRRFAFTSEQLTNHFSQGDLGASYSIWVPWDADGGMQQPVTLVPTFTPEEGSPIKGVATRVVLPGESPASISEVQAGLRRSPAPPRNQGLPPNVRQTTYGTTGYTTQADDARSGVTTTTIPINGPQSRNLNR